MVLDSLQHLHKKLDSVAKHLGVITPGHKPLPSLISAHRGDDHDASADMEHDEQMDSLISQVEATLQHPLAQAPATADIASRSESSSIGAAVRKQLDSVGEQLAQKVKLPSSKSHVPAATIEQLFGIFQTLSVACIPVSTWVASDPSTRLLLADEHSKIVGNADTCLPKVEYQLYIFSMWMCKAGSCRPT